MKGLCDEIHNLGLKAGIYSTPWITSYASYPGGSSDDPDGAWSKALANQRTTGTARNSFAAADANQWAAWGFDYLKYDWNPNDVPHNGRNEQRPAQSGRDNHLQPIQRRPVQGRDELGAIGQLLADHG